VNLSHAGNFESNCAYLNCDVWLVFSGRNAFGLERVIIKSKLLQTLVIVLSTGTLNVVVSGVHSATIHVPSEYLTIQAAISAALPGDTVLVGPGVYSEPINFLGKAIVVRSSDGPQSTIITSDSDSNLVTFESGESLTSVLEGFQLEGGWIAIRCVDAGPTIRQNILTNQNVTNWGAISLGGAGYATEGPCPTVIENVTILGCANGGISTFSTLAPTIKNAIIVGNGHYGIHRQGSGSVAQPVLSYNDVYGNPVSYQEIADSGIGTIAANPKLNPDLSLQGGSPCIDAGDPDPGYNDPDGSRNDMGAVPFDSSVIIPQPTTRRVPTEYATIQLAILSSNNGDTILVGPGIYREAIKYNGKAIIVKSALGPLSSIIVGPENTDVVTFNFFESQTSVFEGFRVEGGEIGIRCANSGPTIRRNVLVGQNITNWGAISLGGTAYASEGSCPAIIENNTILGCTNGGISTFSTVAPTIKNTIIVFNGHYGIHREGSGSVAQPVLSYNDVYGNLVSYQEIADPGVGTISDAPLFGPGYTLAPGSPAIDAGDPDPSYNDSDGSRNDMGAYGSLSFTPICGDMNGDSIVDISDLTYLVTYMFGGGPAPLYIVLSDVDGIRGMTITDLTSLVAFVFSEGSLDCGP